MSEPLEVYTAEQLRGLLRIGRASAQALARRIGVRVSPRRVVVLRSRLEEFLAGEADEAEGRPT